MPIRQYAVTYGITSTLVAAALLAMVPLLGRSHAPTVIGPCPMYLPSDEVQMARPAVDLVFAVDTTGSMGGSIEGAKLAVQSIVSQIRETPGAALRIGLVAYRDLGDEYVTRDFALTADLDAAFTELSGYRAAGGGDPPDSVGAALDDAVNRMAWRHDARKLVFLIGDGPPATRAGEPSFEAAARAAARKRIVVNAIQCGDDPATAVAWTQVAAVTGGRFSTADDDGGVPQIAAAYDAAPTELPARSMRLR